MAAPTGFFFSKTAGTDYLHRAVPSGLDQDKWSFATWLYLPAGFDPDYEAIFAFLNDDDGGMPDSERTLQFGATLGFLGWYDGTNWSWWELDSPLPTQTPVCIQFDYDSAQATAADRLRLYVNGVLQAYEVGYSNPPAQYADTYSGFTDPELVLSGYMLGVAGGGETAAYLSPVIMQGRSLFVSGANPSATDIYAGTLPGSYGTAGWLLEYETPATLGADTSGNDNDWTVAGDSADSWIGLYPTTASLQFGGPLDAYAVRVVIEISAVEVYTVTADIEIDPPTYVVTAGIRISGEETYAATAVIAIQGSMHTAANRTALVWTPLVEIGGSDVSARLTGEIRIEHNEDASNVASFTLLPATGAIDPLGYLNDRVQITWRDAGDGTYVSHDVLRFTGVIVDARWSPDAGTLDIEATSDLQGVVEAMDRDAIADMVGGTWSDIVFDQEADAWTYAQDRLSTTTDTLWQDGAGHLRKAALAAKASPDFTFTDAGRFSDTLAIETASLRDLVNQITITLDYRYPRKRHRQIRVRWKGQQDICTFLQNPYTLCQRDMVQAAAEGGGWSVVGDISYTAVWPPGAYQCGGGINGVSVWGYSPIVAQLDSFQDLSAWCMGATWSAARRWAQSITETHTVVVQCQDSIEAVGVLPRAEDYGTESDVDLSDWEESDAGEGPPAGALQLASGDWAVDADEEGDIDRDAVDEALEVAMAAARGDILRSHRNNRVSFQTVFQPAVKLSHTVRVNTPYLVARGKVVRIEDLLSIDGGDATSTIEIAVSRHEGTGLSASDPIAAPAKPTAADGAVIPDLITLRQYTGGQMADYESPGFEADSYAEIADEGGYFTNVLYNGEVNYTIGVDQVDPQLEAKIYPEQFVVNYPEISGAHIDAVEAVTATTIEVAVPEDELTLAA